MVKRIATAICSAASVISLVVIPGLPLAVKILLILLSIICIAALIYPDNFRKQTTCKNEEKVNEYMANWINQSGQVKILTRDLSWVDDKAVDVMKRKASDITVYAQSETIITSQLSKLGVNFVFYGHIPYDPATRFTIIRANKPDKQIAIANRITMKGGKFKHTIYQTEIRGDDRDKWLISLADDLTHLLDTASNTHDKADVL